MVENHKQSIERFLGEVFRKRQKFATDQETLRQWLQAEADKKIAEYQQGWKTLEPEARKRFADIVKPWWQDFKESGFYDDLIDWHRTSNYSIIVLSNQIVYPWPRTILKQQSNPELFDDAAESISEAINKKDAFRVARLDEQYIPENELWEARFFLTAHESSDKEGLFVSRWPPKGGNYEFVGALALKPREEDQWFAKIHPRVWLEFAEQIESGKSWEVLHESLTW
jgi:hypothetical protein